MATNTHQSVLKTDKLVQIKDGLCPDSAVGGIGIDIVEIGRIRDRLVGQSDLVESLFTSGEITFCQSAADPGSSYATVFALKEAFLKALGTGWQYGIGFREIEIVIEANDHIGINLAGKAAMLAEERGVTGIHASMSTAGELAVATVILEVVNGKG